MRSARIFWEAISVASTKCQSPALGTALETSLFGRTAVWRFACINSCAADLTASIQREILWRGGSRGLHSLASYL
jgi:hypothetical protein